MHKVINFAHLNARPTTTTDFYYVNRTFGRAAEERERKFFKVMFAKDLSSQQQDDMHNC